jgi:hypothetical protein
MNFKQATDALLESAKLEDLAEALGVHVQAVRQARATAGTASHRPPPKGWEAAVSKLAEAKSARFSRLSRALRNKT